MHSSAERRIACVFCPIPVSLPAHFGLAVGRRDAENPKRIGAPADVCPRRAGDDSWMSEPSHTAAAGRSGAPGLLSGLTPVEQARIVFAAFDAKDVDGLAALVSEDVLMRLGNAEEAQGKLAFVEAVRAFLSSVASFHHQILNVWHESDALIAQLEVRYTRHDGQEVTLPCCNVFRLRGGFVVDYRVYMDISPVYA